MRLLFLISVAVAVLLCAVGTEAKNPRAEPGKPSDAPCKKSKKDNKVQLNFAIEADLSDLINFLSDMNKDDEPVAVCESKEGSEPKKENEEDTSKAKNGTTKGFKSGSQDTMNENERRGSQDSKGSDKRDRESSGKSQTGGPVRNSEASGSSENERSSGSKQDQTQTEGASKSKESGSSKQSSKEKEKRKR